MRMSNQRVKLRLTRKQQHPICRQVDEYVQQRRLPERVLTVKQAQAHQVHSRSMQVSLINKARDENNKPFTCEVPPANSFISMFPAEALFP